MDYRKQLDEALAMANDTKVFEFGNDVLGLAPKLFRENFGDKPALVVADKNTWRAAGKVVTDFIKDAGIKCDTYIFEEDEFHAEFEFVDRVDTVSYTHLTLPTNREV